MVITTEQLVTMLLQSTELQLVNISNDAIEIDTDVATLPLIHVDYATVRGPQQRNTARSAVYNRFNEDTISSYDITLLCDRSSVQTWWKAIAKAMNNASFAFNPLVTGFAYNTGGRMGRSGNRILWADRWDIAFPSMFIV